MKKNILYLIMFALAAITFTSCDKESEDKSSIVDYPKITILGDVFYISPQGSTYTDPGCTVTYQGVDYTSKVVVSGLEDIDINTAGLYYVTYSAVSPDGYRWSETRTVAVCDPNITTDLSGDWTLQTGSYRNYDNEGEVGFEEYGITIQQLAPGIFSVSDFFAGWYDQRAGYGKKYAMVGQIQLLADGSLKLLSSKVEGWNDSLDDDFVGSYDEDTGILTWDTGYAEKMVFHVVLKQ